MNPAPKLIQQLLLDIMVWCESCMCNIKAIDYTSHCCSTVRKQEMQLVSKVVHQMLSTSAAAIWSACNRYRLYRDMS